MAQKADKNGARQAVMRSFGNGPAPKKGRVGSGRSIIGRPEPDPAQVKALLGGMPDGICIFDKTGTITYCNASFAAISRLPLRKLAGRKLRKNALWGEQGKADEFRELWQRAMGTGQQVTVAAQPVSKPGQPTRYWNLKLVPYLSRKKRFDGMNLQIKDVTEEARLQNRERLLTRYYASALRHQSVLPLLEELASLLKEYSGCPSVQIVIMDSYGNRALKAGSGRSLGLWDGNSSLSQSAIELLFNEVGAEFSCGSEGSLYIGNIAAVQERLEGSLSKLVMDAVNSYSYKSLALVPVRLKEKVAGYILLAGHHAEGITRGIVETVESVSGHLQVIIEYAGLRDELRRQRRGLLKQMYERSAHLEALSERLKQESAERKKAQDEMRVQRDLAVALNGIENLDEALRLCLDTAILVSGMDSGGIYLADPLAGGFKLAVSRGLSEGFIRQVTYYNDSEPSAGIINSGQSVYSTYNELGMPTDKIRQSEELKGMGVIPIMHEDRAVACLNIASHVFDEIPFSARNAVEAIAADLGTFVAHIVNREALVESEERYRTLFARTPNPIMVKDTEGNYIAGNDAALAFLECTREEFLAMNVKNTLPPYLDEGWYANLRSIWETGGTVERDYYVWGKIKVLELTITPLQVGGRKIIFGIGRDVTERKRAETELKLSEERYRLLAENSLDVIWTAGMDLSPAYISPSVLLHTGYTADEVKDILTHGHGYAASLGIEERDIERKLIALKALIDGEAERQVIEYQVKSRDGKIYWADEKMSILRDGEGKKVGIIGVIRDSTAQKKMTENLIIADRLVSLGEMAAGLAHEVNNPLTAIMGFAYLLQQNPATPAEIRENVESIYKESRRAADVIKNFLAFSRGQGAEKKAEQINSLVENVLKLRQSRMQKENISVNLELAEALPSVHCDATQIQQAMLNIILNAEYFMYQTHQRGTLVISTRLCGGNVSLSVADDGPGITPDKIDHVFDPFYTSKQVGEGTGLGLSICHSIVRGHGGNVYVESSPGKGAIFTIELPAGQQGFMLS